MDNYKEIKDLLFDLKQKGISVNVNITGVKKKSASYPFDVLNVRGDINMKTLGELYGELSILFHMLRKYEMDLINKHL